MTNRIKFILNGELCEVSDFSPTTTLLQYLRSTKRLMGTKEGCAEGDCGACTVVVASYNEPAVRAINSCITFLPTLDGRQITTIENLATDGNLHPVQAEMVKSHASQCGFCTPGFVMSLSALTHNQESPVTNCHIQDAISGNLCRCTGYRSILDAAKQACQLGHVKLPVDTDQLKRLRRDNMFVYESEGQQFFAPVTPAELTDVLAQHPKVVILSGGTDVGLWVTKHHRKLDTMIYIGNIDELQQINNVNGFLEIGAAVSYFDAFKYLAAYDESFEELLRRLGSTQIRNAGTLGGNIANGSPIGDGMPPLIALEAKIILRSASGARTLALENYFLAYGKQDKKSGEFLEKVIIPHRAQNSLFKTYKISKRFDQDISAVCGAFALSLKKDKIFQVRIAFGGMAATPRRATLTEKFLTGKTWSERTVQEAMKKIDEDFKPLSDMRASESYRQEVARNLLYRFYLEATESSKTTRVYNYGN